MKAIQNIFTGQWFGKKIMIGLVIALFCMNILPMLGSFLSPEFSSVGTVFAEEPTETSKSINASIDGAVTSELKKKIADWTSLFLSFFTFLIAIIVKFVGVLMGDEYIMGSNNSGGFRIDQLLYSLWDVVRTLVNYSFLLILLFFAFMNVIPIGTDNYELKKVLPKFILAIVIVNMTWFGVRVVFDVVDVTTRVVFALPESIANEDFKSALKTPCTISNKPLDKDGVVVEGAKTDSTSTKLYVHGTCYPAHIQVDPTQAFTTGKIQTGEESVTSVVENIDKEIAEINGNAGITAENKAKYIESLKSEQKKYAELQKTVKQVVNYGGVSIYWSDFNYEQFNESSIGSLLAFSVMQVQNLPRMAETNVSKLTGDASVAKVQGYTGLFINALAAFIIMVVILILFVMMLVNLFFRIIILWINIIASPLMALKMVLSDVGGGMDPAPEYLGAGAFLKYAFAPVIMGIPLVIGFIMVTVGKQYGVMGLNGEIAISGALIDGVSDIHQLFYYILTIAILWIGGVKAMEMASIPAINSAIIEPLKNGVNGAAGLVPKALGAIRFIPAGGGNDGMKFASFNNLAKDMPAGLNRRMAKFDADSRQKFLGVQDTFNQQIDAKSDNASEALEKNASSLPTYEALLKASELPEKKDRELAVRNLMPEKVRPHLGTPNLSYEDAIRYSLGRDTTSVPDANDSTIVNTVINNYNKDPDTPATTARAEGQAASEGSAEPVGDQVPPDSGLRTPVNTRDAEDAGTSSDTTIRPN